jgi:serine/threonine protein kinase
MEKLKLVGQRRELLPERSVWKYFLQTTLGLNHIHARNILHRDVKVRRLPSTRKDPAALTKRDI